MTVTRGPTPEQYTVPPPVASLPANGDNQAIAKEKSTMSTVVESKLVLRPELNGAQMTTKEFDAADIDDELHVYELINGVLIVSPPPLEEERDPNGELE